MLVNLAGITSGPKPPKCSNVRRSYKAEFQMYFENYAQVCRIRYEAKPEHYSHTNARNLSIILKRNLKMKIRGGHVFRNRLHRLKDKVDGPTSKHPTDMDCGQSLLEHGGHQRKCH